ncbi:MAG TPA: hypothetical protein VEY12_10215 [Thermoplasmata archaeon]|nr:hypothetical protein [Thermoplasmata archaeon]
MRGIAATLIALAVLAVPLALASTAAASSNMSASAAQNLTPVFVGPTPTNRFGGGDWVGVTAGNTHFGVVYGTSTNPNTVVIFAEYPRILGGADVVNQQGQQVAVRGIPVDTVLAQSFDRFIEFRTLNVSEGFGLFSDSGLPLTITVNQPVKALNLRTGAWTMTSESYETVGSTFYVNFTIAATDLAYTWINPHIPNANGTGDHMLNRVAFTFHLTVDTANKTADIPWYRVTVTDTTPREITNVTFVGYHTVSGPTVQMGAKYDHNITGWDFANLTDKLALETHLILGNFYPDRTVDFVHLAYAQERAEDGTNSTILDNETAGDAPSAPHLYTFSKITFDDRWTRIGEFRWTSNVTVDGKAETMLFQVQGGSRIAYTNGESAFYGFTVHGAFIYPAGYSIVHDPAMSVESFTPNVTSGFNLTPLGILLIQVAVVGVAIIPALYLRSRARRPKN